MTTFVRKNIAVCKAVFTPTDPALQGITLPGAASLVLHYKDPAGAQRRETLEMQPNMVTGVWTALWDTSASGEGPVHWMVYCFGDLQAAIEGCFDVQANSANVV